MNFHLLPLAAVAMLAFGSLGCGRQGDAPPNQTNGDVAPVFGLQAAGEPVNGQPNLDLNAFKGVIPPEKRGRYVTAKAGAKIEVGGKVFPLFEGRTYPLRSSEGREFVVDYFGKTGFISKAGAWPLEDAVRHYAEQERSNPLTFPATAAAGGHVAVAAGDLYTAKIRYGFALERNPKDVSARLGAWESTIGETRFSHPGPSKEDWDAYNTFELGQAVVRCAFHDIERASSDRWANALHPDKSGYRTGEAAAVRHYFQLKRLFDRLEREYPDYMLTLELRLEVPALGKRLGGPDKMAGLVKLDEERAARYWEFARQAREEEKKIYSEAFPLAKSSALDLRQLLEREAAARERLDKPAIKQYLEGGELVLEGKAHYELGRRWLYRYRDHPVETRFYRMDWSLVVKLPARSPGTDLGADCFATLNGVLARLEQIQQTAKAAPDKTPPTNDVHAVVAIRRLCAGVIGIDRQSGVPGVQLPPTADEISLSTRVSDMEALADLLANRKIPPAKDDKPKARTKKDEK